MGLRGNPTKVHGGWMEREEEPPPWTVAMIVEGVERGKGRSETPPSTLTVAADKGDEGGSIWMKMQLWWGNERNS
ncbi:hypothetical protein VNO77_02002 [Canavalia gladiata]|uniref:Uncharacterized protein n=1 Tax=Canavalia gladiata TaxID=3824 RepID=A0AAN9MS91_CANGL